MTREQLRERLFGGRDLMAPVPEPGPPVPAESPAPRKPRPRSFAISPALSFAVGVAGIVTATVAYFQMGQFLSRRTAVAPARAQGAPPVPTAVTTGRVEISSEPAGAAVAVNGVRRGVTPLSLAEVPAGRLEVSLTRGCATITRAVDLNPGGSATVAVSFSAATPSPAVAPAPVATAVPGWVTIESPLELRVFEGGRLRGTTRDRRLALSPGTRTLSLVSDALEIRQTLTVTVAPGQTTSTTVTLPSGSLSVNALPWADVWIDGSPVGTTPLANLSVPVGSHEILWRHPTLGERRQSVVVKAATPARVGVDLNR